MNKEKISWIEVMNRFDEFETSFANDPNDPELTKFFENFGADVIGSGFSDEQLSEIIGKMNNLRELFASRKKELKKLSAAALEKKKQLTRYLKNANYKSLVK